MTARRLTLACGWLSVLAVVLTALAAAGDPPLLVSRYAAVWAVSTTFPGVMVWRALCRPTDPGQEYGFGSVLGIGLLLLAWVPATLLHSPWLMWLLPVSVTVAFATSPRLRGHWRPRRAERHLRPLRWHVTLMVVVLLGFLRVWATRLRSEALPPHASTIFQDEWYEIGLAQHLTRTVGLDDPAAAGVRLHYHWFSNAHVAATQLLSGAPLPEVVLHLWPVMMLVVFVFAVGAATERIVDGAMGPGTTHDPSWWPGPLAALLAAAWPVTLGLGATQVPAIDNGFVVSSTSGLLALVVVLALVGPVLDLLGGHRSPGTWVVLSLLLALSAGTKPSVLPVVACGSALVASLQWLRHRVVDTVAVVLTVASLLLIPVAAAASLVGSTGGSRLQLLATLTLDRSFLDAAHGRVGLPGHGGWLTPALTTGGVDLWVVALGVFLLFTLTELPRLLGLLGATHATARNNPGVWWCSGVVGSGWCGLWLLAHPGYSQHYFWRIVIGLAVALTVATTALQASSLPSPSDARADLVRFGVGGLATGLAVAAVWRQPDDSVSGRLAPYAVATLVFAGLALLARRRTRQPIRLPTAALASCFVVATALPVTLGSFVGAVVPAVADVAPQAGPAPRTVTEDEQVAALWLHDHSQPDAVVATNVFCAPVRYRTGCAHTAFWLAALTGRQLLLGSWAYTEASMTADGRQDVPYSQGPPPWPDRLALSLRAVRSPERRALESLRERGVTWIYADRRATAVSPRLDRLCILTFHDHDVAIYRLRR